jgi:hypothetical protein
MGVQIEDHVLGEMPVLADEYVVVIGHDGARVTGVALLIDHVRKALGEEIALRRVEGEQVVLQPLCGFAIEFADLPARGLNAFPSVM